VNAQVKEQWPVNAQPISYNVPHVYTAILKVMSAVGKAGISKDRQNTQQNYSFRGIDDVYNALNGFLADASLLILPRVMKREVTERVTKSGGAIFYVALDVEFDLVSAEDGSKHTIAMAGEAMDSADKATNKAMSAAYKYACMEVFCIPTEGDNDADGTTHDIAGKPVPEDCFIALADAAKLGAKALTEVWENQMSEATRERIKAEHAERLEIIRALVPKRPV
jgi:hypothetical protein